MRESWLSIWTTSSFLAKLKNYISWLSYRTLISFGNIAFNSRLKSAHLVSRHLSTSASSLEGHVKMDLVKVTGVWEWQIPRNMTEVQWFLGLSTFIGASSRTSCMLPKPFISSWIRENCDKGPGTSKTPLRSLNVSSHQLLSSFSWTKMNLLAGDRHLWLCHWRSPLPALWWWQMAPDRIHL